MRPLAIALTLGTALVIGVLLSPRLPLPPGPPPAPLASVTSGVAPGSPDAEAALSPEVRLGLPDCPAGAIADLRGANALECWFRDDAHGVWHVTSSLEIQGTTLLRLVGSDRGVAEAVARRLVEQGGEGAHEVLVYARNLRGPDVTRVRWTRSGGFETSDFAVP